MNWQTYENKLMRINKLNGTLNYAITVCTTQALSYWLRYFIAYIHMNTW